MSTPQQPVPPTGPGAYGPSPFPQPGFVQPGQPAPQAWSTPPGGSTPPAPGPNQPAPQPPARRGNVLTSKPVIGIAALLVGLGLGAGAGASGEPAAVTAAAAPTVTVTAPAPTVTVTAAPEATDRPTPTPSATPSQEPTKAATKPPAPPKKSYQTLSSRKFKLLAKDPDAYIGKTYVIYGEITQFDSATGTDTFRADTGPKKLRISYGYTDYEQNSMLTGAESKLKELVEDDCFKAKVTVLGSYSYDTQIGGNTTVPLFQVDSISVYGSTD